MKILLKGYYGFGNLGDDILMIVSYKLLKEKYPEAEITLFSNNSTNNKDSKSPKGYNLYIKQLLGEDVEIVDWTYNGHFDLLVNGGGGVYFDNKPAGIGYLTLNKLSNKIPISFIVKADRLLRKGFNRNYRMTFSKRIGLGIGVGPFTNSSSKLIRSRIEISTYNKLLLRESISYEEVVDLNCNKELVISSDLSFLTEYWLEKELESPAVVPNGIGIILKGKSEVYYDHYRSLIRELIEQDYQPLLFAFDMHFDDDMLSEFQGECSIHIWDPHNISLINYLSHLRKCEVCISDRAHGALLAGILNIPTLIIKSSLKSNQVTEMIAVNEKTSRVKKKMNFTLDDVKTIQNNAAKVKNELAYIMKRNQSTIKSQIKSVFD